MTTLRVPTICHNSFSNCTVSCQDCYQFNGACAISPDLNCRFSCPTTYAPKGLCYPKYYLLSSVCEKAFPNSTLCQLACSKCKTPSRNGVAAANDMVKFNPAQKVATCSYGLRGLGKLEYKLSYAALNPGNVPVLDSSKAVYVTKWH
ncbi:hypothetical protein HDU78_008296 [Chytriomyces hyalinus]|nr:hypothetical protein HDU78_008296 [Chytriomyces hyalinus]